MYLKGWSARNFTIFPLSSPSAHSEMSCFGLNLYPPPKKKNKTSLSKPKGHSGERGGGAKNINFDEIVFKTPDMARFQIIFFAADASADALCRRTRGNYLILILPSASADVSAVKSEA